VTIDLDGQKIYKGADVEAFPAGVDLVSIAKL
jgi:hypothetical protein